MRPPKAPREDRILGVTVATPAFLDLAVEATRRWSAMTQQHATILVPPTNEGAYHWKLLLPQLVRPGPVCYFDADLWFIRPCDPLELLRPGGISGVQDVGIENPATFAFADCGSLGLDRTQYINSGFFVCDTADPKIVAAFAAAEQMSLWKTRVADFGEQSYLNAGIQRNCGVHLVDMTWNFGPWAGLAGLCDKVPSRPNTIHALGVPLPLKRERLALWESAFSPGIAPDLGKYKR